MATAASGSLLARLTAKGRAGCLARPLPLALSYTTHRADPAAASGASRAAGCRGGAGRRNRSHSPASRAARVGRGRRPASRTSSGRRPSLLLLLAIAVLPLVPGGAPLVGAEQLQAAGRPGARRRSCWPTTASAATAYHGAAAGRADGRWRCSSTRSSATSSRSSSCCPACT